MPLLISWIVVLAWLAVMVVVQLNFSWLWLSDGASPRRHEALLGVAMAAFYSLPAVVGLAFFRWLYWSESPAVARRAATILVTVALVLLAASLALS